ncbi:MAG: hypothetical protein K2M10_07430 [Muribaculaceae bacterium]|nr:hypothetical protein [Muribaculaceae bacterium]MDE6299458.1 hypothetical protein [Muribaculaceae bacterium]
MKKIQFGKSEFGIVWEIAILVNHSMVDKKPNAVFFIFREFKGELHSVGQRLATLKHISEKHSFSVEHLDKFVNRPKMR